MSKKIILTDEQIAQVEALAAYLSIDEIADYFDIDADTFLAIRKRQPEVFRLYKKGKAHKILRYAKKLDAIAMGDDQNGDTAAIIFFLKTQGGWSTTEKTKPSFKISDNKDPVKIIDAAIDGWNNGDLTLQEAEQLASLALAKKNIQTNALDTDKAEHERFDSENSLVSFHRQYCE
jgi:hypothetical protein